MLIEKIEELNELIQSRVDANYQCILSLIDNKSTIILQHVVVKHPLDFIRNLNEFSKNLRLPVSDLSINLIGFIGPYLNLCSADEICEISPYVYFKRPEEVDINVGSDDSSPSVES